GEYMTAYTPYQAEASQGTLQLIYEYQTMITGLTGMDVSNASVYDGGSALGEAVLMAVRANRAHPSNRTGGPRPIAVAGACHPHYVDAAANIARNQGIELVPTGTRDGRVDLDALASMTGERLPVAVIVQQPNFFGLIEPVDEIADWATANGALVIAVVNPTSLALLKPPGEWGTNGADIACGDGQPLGIPMASGGPSFGFLCTRLSLVRQLPGRLVGRTVDRHDRSGFTLTLQAREQHIRRGKARSNICTNQGLLVTAATIYLAIVGAVGLSRVASRCHERTRQLVRTLTAVNGVQSRFAGPYFHEHVIDVGQPAEGVADAVAELGIIGGLPLGRYFADLRNCLLLCATEKRTDADIARYGDALRQVLNG
ncbi:MAG: aminomethyl-transferring glycine dehydrogenase subunit GcvPA, partial [Gammaproteobacteria bacterium]|nr:aminomethyl-transferring glycine dehydrogenase subunit GcvPA [Gammaproteobacteria bacterium]